MKWKSFSPEEVVSLRKNPYTLKATEKNVTFTLQFKQAMLDGLQQGKSPESMMRELGYDPAVIGDSRVKGIAYHITKEAESPEGLHEGRRTPRKARAVTEEEIASSAPSHSLRRLQAEVSYSQQEAELPSMMKQKLIERENREYTSEGFEVSDDTLKQEAAYAIFGEADPNDTLKLLGARGFVVSADTAEELAAALGLDGTALAATVEQWNADCAASADSLFGNHKLQPLEGKLYGYRFGVGAHYMMGGLLINGYTQVLDESETPIPGLYAAGETTGGFHGEVRIDGSGTGDAFTFGHLAGEKLAAAVAK